jgi:ribA/ribD-fused uncharacterized protein
MDKQILLKSLTEGEKFNYTGFSIGVLSNWHPAEFKAEGKTFRSSEQYYMYKKAMVFRDEETAKKILEAYDAKRAQELGRKVKNFDKNKWDSSSDIHMFIANILKFSQNREMAKVLLNTQDNILVYANPADRLWGAGIDMMDGRISEPFEWPGQNKLGFILTEVRDDLKETLEDQA